MKLVRHALVSTAAITFLMGATGAFAAHEIIVHPAHFGTFSFRAEYVQPPPACEGGDPSPGTLVVNDDFSSNVPPHFVRIRDALNEAESGYTILICAGEYYEHLEIEKDDLHLIGEGPDVTIVDGRAPKKGTIFEIKEADRIEIEGLTIRNGSNGIEAKKTSGHSFHNNVFRDNEHGIELEKTSGVTISGNEFIGNKDGIEIEESASSAGHSITKNHFSGNRRGIVLEDADGVLIEMNTISTGKIEGTHGILLESSNGNSIVGNQISDKTWGIELLGDSGENDIRGNRLTGNEVAIQLKLKSGKKNTIMLNTIQSNGIGILQLREDGGVGEATIYHNGFLSNVDHVAGQMLGSNHWDVGYDCTAPDGGNFWDDHTTPDAKSGPGQDKLGADLIVDVPRGIGPGAEDRYPFVAQDAWLGFGGINCGDPIITLVADPLAIPADETSTSVITATAVDEAGRPVADGTLLTFTTTLGSFQGDDQQLETVTTGGQSTVTLLSGMESGIATVTAVANGDFGQIEVEFKSVALGPPLPPTPEPSPEPEGSVHPILECVGDNGNGSYTARFGFLSDYEELVEIAIGPQNRFDPEPVDRGQPEVFEPGRTPTFPDSAFTVEFDGSELVWILGGETATASDNPEQRCADPEPEPSPTPLPEFEVKINFQPGSAPVPDGYLVDSGEEFGDWGNGYSYGWDENNEFSRDRDSSGSPDQRYDTLNHMQKPENPDATWEIEVLPGTYSVFLVAGDSDYFDSVYQITVEGVLAIDGAPNGDTQWFETELVVTVGDGLLTVSSGPGAENNKINFIEIELVESL